MPNASWPASPFPQAPLLDSFTESQGSVVVVSPSTPGYPAKRRQRVSASVKAYTCKLALTKAEVATLLTFFDTTLAGGSLPFDWLDARTGSARTFYITAPPAITPLATDLWNVDLQLESQP